MGRSFAVFVAIGGMAWGQSLTMALSGTTSPGVVTAGERFRIAIQVREAAVYGAGFRLWYSPSSVVRFAGWQAVDYDVSELLVVAADGAEEGKVEVSGISLAQRRQSPVVAVLEFVLAPEASHGSVLSFRLSNGWLLQEDSLRWVPAVTLSLRVHGYVVVWPGDADNDGAVDGRDVATVGLYAYRRAAGYRRNLASTVWGPQMALAWLEPKATYADCDGNGYVTVRDLAVVLQNYGRRRSAAQQVEEVPLVPPPIGHVIASLSVPVTAELLAGVFVPCAGSTVVGVRSRHTSLSPAVTATTDSLTAVVLHLKGADRIGIVGQGKLCDVLLEYRTSSGEWHPVEWRESPLEVGGADSQLRLSWRDGWLCLEGERATTGMLTLFTLEGRVVGRFSIPAGEGVWCVELPSLPLAPYIGEYMSAAKARIPLLLLP
ncbi:MAG: hypothetical protein ABDH31_02035 [Chlorobiota bacterium]